MCCNATVQVKRSSNQKRRHNLESVFTELKQRLNSSHFRQIHACMFREISPYLHRVNPVFMQTNSRQYLKEMFLYLSGISMYRNNLIKWEHKTHKHLPAKNVTLPWCLVLVPPGCWNVIICTNRKQTGLQVSGCCLFSLSQAQQHQRTRHPPAWPSSFSQHSLGVLCQFSQKYR